jgi:hypothetical protein
MAGRQERGMQSLRTWKLLGSAGHVELCLPGDPLDLVLIICSEPDSQSRRKEALQSLSLI